MTRAAVVVLFGALASGQPVSLPESLRFNAGERTARGLAALEHDDFPAAAESLAAAARLAPADPRTRFNDGTARLLVGDDSAKEVLATSADEAPPELKAPAFYNLGNSQLAAGNAEAAIAAYEEALRAAPSLYPAKHNLELALRLLDQQRQQQEEQQGDSDQEPQTNPDGESRAESQEGGGPSERNEDQQAPGQAQPSPAEETSANEEGSENDVLPGFDPQDDMTPEQAAAILEAVENLEREQRRREAEERARRRPGGGKDW